MRIAKRPKRLIPEKSVDGVFNDSVIGRLAKIAKLSPEIDRRQFGNAIRSSVRAYLKAAGYPTAAQVLTQIGMIYALVIKTESGKDVDAQRLATALESLPHDLKKRLERAGPRPRRVPTAAQILSSRTRVPATNRVRRLVSYGGFFKEGRKRAGGRRSKSFEPLLRADKVMRGRPTEIADRVFVQYLAIDWLTFKGAPPPRTANYNKGIRGPFPTLVHECFELVRATTGNVTRILNSYGAARPKA